MGLRLAFDSLRFAVRVWWSCVIFWKLPRVFVTLWMAVEGRLSKAMAALTWSKDHHPGSTNKVHAGCVQSSPDFLLTILTSQTERVWQLDVFKRSDFSSYLTSGCVWRELIKIQWIRGQVYPESNRKAAENRRNDTCGKQNICLADLIALQRDKQSPQHTSKPICR